MILKHRTYFTTISAGLLILLIAGLRNPKERSNTSEQLVADRFWIMKAQNKGKYDLLILGDSRSYRGVDPDEMEKIIPGIMAYNFAFSSGGLNPGIYKAAEKLLDIADKKSTILIGVTPSSLTALDENNPQYNLEHNRPHSAYLERVYINSQLQRFSPFDHTALLAELKSKGHHTPVYISDYHDDGWVGSHKEPEDTTEALASYRKEMEQYKVKPELVKALIDQTREWTSKGIQVFAFRPPTTQAMLDMENSMSGFDEKVFVNEFEAAGGVWINVDRSQYHSYDGSHLDEASAKKLSAFLAEEIKKKDTTYK